jgi:hypothetical protein
MPTAYSKRTDAFTRVARQKPRDTIDAATLALEALAHQLHAEGQHRFVQKSAAG